MAAGKSGSFELSTNGFTMRVSWSETYSIEDNSSYVSITSIEIKSSWWYGFSYYPDGLIKINGSVAIKMDSNLGTHSVTTHALNEYSTVSRVSGGVTVPHNADGSKTVTIEVTGNRFSKCYWYTRGGDGGSGFGFTGTNTVALTTIPRATVPKLSHSTISMGATMTVDLTSRASSSFSHIVYVRPKSTGKWQTVISKTAATKPTFKVPDFSSSIPNATSDVVTVSVETYNGGTLIGEKQTAFTATVPSSYIPTISVSASEGYLSGYSSLIQKHSKLSVSVTAKGLGGATIKEISSQFEGSTYRGSSWTSKTISGSGQLKIRTTVKDSRDRTSTKEATVSVAAYAIPSITLLKADRCNADHSLNPTGEYARIMYSYAVSCSAYGVTGTMRIKSKARSAENYSTIKSGSGASANQAKWYSGAIFSKLQSYDIRLEISDSLNGNAAAMATLRSEEVIMDIKADGRGIAFGKIAEQSQMVELGWDLDLFGNRIKNQG